MRGVDIAGKKAITHYRFPKISGRLSRKESRGYDIVNTD